MSKNPKRQGARKPTKTAKERAMKPAMKLGLLLPAFSLMEIYKLHAKPEPLSKEQRVRIAKLGLPWLPEALPGIESAIDASQKMRDAFSNGSEESAGLATKRGEARKIHNALAKVMSQIEDFIRRDETEYYFRPSSDFQHAMAGLRYVLRYFDIESKAAWGFDWGLYFLIRELDFIWNEYTGEHVKRSGKISEAFVVEVCRIALEPINTSTITNALKHYISARRGGNDIAAPHG